MGSFIPKKFAKRYRNDLSNKVTIQVPSGAVCDVELVKSRDDMWFQTGWKEFAEFYSIAYGYFLVFEYKRSCHFLVHIFDTTTCEVDYPLTNGDKKPNLRSKEPRNVQPEDTDSVEILEKFAPKRKAKDKWNSQCPPSKKMNINSTSTYETTTKGIARSGGMKQENSSTDVKAQFKENEGQLRLPGQRERSNKIVQNQLNKPLSKREKVDCLSIVSSAFIPNYPSFKVVMQPSYFRDDRVLVPISFPKNYLKQSGNALLHGSDGKTWPVYCHIKEYRGQRTMYICRGWKKFVKANDLVVGDVCFFELLMISEMGFRVTIFRASQMSHGRALSIK